MLVKIFGSYAEEVSKASARYKYGGDPMAEYLDLKGSDYSDEWSGHVECPTGWFARFGRRILFHSEQGFVWVEKWPSDRAAAQVFAALERYYYTWDDEESDLSDAALMLLLDECNAFLGYVAECARENLEAFDFDSWVVRDKPKGPLG